MKLGTLTIEPAVMNGACSVAKTPEDVKELCSTGIGAIVIGSITVEPRVGNPEPRWFVGENYALNSFGMPNGGLEYYAQHLEEMVATAHEHRKALILSVAGFSVDDYAALVELGESSGVDAIELNLGCPNVTVDGKQKPIASFNQEYIKDILKAATGKTAKPLTVKLSPYSNPAELAGVAALLAEYEIAGVVTSNTFPNSFVSLNGAPVLANEYGGLSGKAILPFAVGQVRQFRAQLPESIAVIGAGGIETVADADLYFGAGASAVQAATLIVRDGHQAIDNIIAKVLT